MLLRVLVDERGEVSLTTDAVAKCHADPEGGSYLYESTRCTWSTLYLLYSMPSIKRFQIQ